MNSFRFQTVPTVIVESGAARRLGALLREAYPQALRLCVVTDGFLAKSGLLAPALDDLGKHGWQVTVIDDVVADPPEHIVLEATERARQANAEVVLGLGGGSSMDVAKLIAVLLPATQSIQDMYGVKKVTGTRLPLVQMPTTAGTGSEVTAVSIVTTGETTKMGVVAPQLFADLAILDAELTLGLPRGATAATGIDAMVHAIEAYTSAHLKNPVSDMLAVRALQLLSQNLMRACDNGHDLAAREAMLLGAMFAGQSFANSPVAAVHALAYPIGGIFHVAHGLSNALVLPHVMKFNAPAACKRYAELCDVVLPGTTGSDETKTAALIAHIEGLIEATGIPRTLREVGVKQADLSRMASDAMLQTRLLVNNPREVTEADAFAIYSAAF
ncbi:MULTISPECIES: iron-containing alcohol dehydrogenase [unclassified Cupriavidus]|uniref:iron-containing alcohol dehydrogenase n=1 Tax=unclassified Cupriavidus TaxID=2640874 RepID=UPI001BFFDC19|nr:MULTISPECIES: iron-containing alcohol dehydrogenase [unclassified Cupriavidus]MCA3188736.1 iron-containing alcohol dehydrogenase [Cupriavidus sp.]MCA3199752.1 iron-containing alcohol dehydrogenase [Cupriavidus sp.]MCA3205226.1 iron-containing alcohol dehydrogenase [Cupriavidus sp.]MCA3210354.1 iron-containing alcohol dehydrogenase [Cupriavidus sp.]MCA3233778.1 iron-containing alcohol dehydrogenase [Cupriavidus sp.]